MNESPEFLSSKDALFSAPPRRRYKVIGPLPIAGTKLRIQSLSEGELSAHQACSVGKDGFKLARLEDANRRLIARCLVDADGNRILIDADAPKLADWDAADATYVYNECAAHVGIRRSDIEDLAKN
jgi:hypothetical protein